MLLTKGDKLGRGQQSQTLAAVRKELLEKYDIEIGAGVKEYTNTVWRIGLMGPNAAPESVTLILGALREVLGL